MSYSVKLSAHSLPREGSPAAVMEFGIQNRRGKDGGVGTG